MDLTALSWYNEHIFPKATRSTDQKGEHSMPVSTIPIGDLSVSKLILGGNPFSGFSHQTPEKDRLMRNYYTVARIKETMRQAEELGINTFLGRADRHIQHVLLEYWNEGGSIQWFAQTCPEYVSVSRSISEAINGGAKASYLHGGQMDFLFAQDQLHQVSDSIAQIRDAGLPAGIAGHNPRVFEWAEEHVDVDFYMCAYYNPSRRDKQAEHVSGVKENFAPQDREAMVKVIQHLSKPVIHYKVLAAGRNDPQEAFAFVAKYLRPQDAVCVGVYTQDQPKMLEEDLQILESSLQGVNSR
jgi:hypothetical protein